MKRLVLIEYVSGSGGMLHAAFVPLDAEDEAGLIVAAVAYSRNHRWRPTVVRVQPEVGA